MQIFSKLSEKLIRFWSFLGVQIKGKGKFDSFGHSGVPHTFISKWVVFSFFSLILADQLRDHTLDQLNFFKINNMLDTKKGCQRLGFLDI